MKTYKNHRCNRQHRTETTFLRCALPTAAWVHGHGAYALIAWCNVPTITLYETPEAAEEPKRIIDGGSCGQRCKRRHEIVRVDIGSR